MANIYTIELTDVEQKAMEYISTDVNFWIQNAIHERARLAIEEMVGDHINDKLAKGEAISGTKETMALQTTLPSAKKRNEAKLLEIQASMAATMDPKAPKK